MADAVELSYERLFQLRADANTAIERAEAAESKAKQLEQTLLEKHKDIKSLRVKLDTSEDALENTENALREAMEKVAVRARDVKAERQAMAAQQERDKWETKCEEIDTKYRGTKAELDELEGRMEAF
ncbi:hypothetical protein C8F04DRAFT_1181370 [Mycena alexandri]|uniref:Tropomyosin n=1 Tax=Mycena alexandri TaxID=1745969 RepID=A0AAD6T094_9AGAR|nr:hypothetical protein C8F04DRAFT_1181370 [Mycena alexandri]